VSQVKEPLTVIKEHFADINGDPQLTDEDRAVLKEFYLDEFVTPKARKLLEKHFPDELKDFVPDRKPYRRRKVWVNPDGHALAFLKKYQEKPASGSS
jgi:hypothetical protein